MGDDVVQRGRLLGRHGTHRVAQQRSRWTPPGRPAAEPASSRCPARACGARPGRWTRRSVLLVAGRAGREVRSVRRWDQRIRGERALAGAGEVEHPRIGPQLRHLAQPGQRAGRVEQGHLHAAPGGQVAEGAEQRGLATARLGHEDGQTRPLAHLHREVQVEEDRTPRCPGRPSDEVTPPVAHCGRGLRQRGGQQLHRHASQIPGVGQRLARNELPGQRVLALRMLQRHAQFALVELDDPTCPLEALLAGRARTPPAGASRARGWSRPAGRWSSRRRGRGPAGPAAPARAARPCRARRSRAAGSGSSAAGAPGCGRSHRDPARRPGTTISIGHGSRSWKCSHGSCRSGISSGSMRPTVSTATCFSSPVRRFIRRVVEP